MINLYTDNGPDYYCSRCEKNIIGEIGHNCDELMDEGPDRIEGEDK